jgi:hypothetical protein
MNLNLACFRQSIRRRVVGDRAWVMRINAWLVFTLSESGVLETTLVFDRVRQALIQGPVDTPGFPALLEPVFKAFPLGG